jgi:Tfp pilus assembly protein PilZ
MKKEGQDNRSTARFPIKGATLQYKKNKTCLIVNLSRGGVNFLSQEPLPVNNPITMKITIPGQVSPLTLNGLVCWCLPDPGRSDEYQIGAQFLAFEKKRGSNDPRLLERLVKLENWK